MRRIKQLLTMRFGAGASTREIARGVGRGAQHGARVPGPGSRGGDWLAAGGGRHRREPDGAAVRQRGRACRARYHAEPDWAALVRELKRPGVNLMVLWEEYRAVHPEGYAYSRFCQLFREFERRLSPTMRQQHAAGHKAFVDYSGKLVPITDPVTGAVSTAEIFVAVLGASSLTYAEATWTQTLPDWIGAHVRMFRFWGAVAAAAGAGQPQERHPQGIVLRPGGEPQLRRDGVALRRRHPAQPGQSAHATRPPWRQAYVSRSPTSSAACAM